MVAIEISWQKYLPRYLQENICKKMLVCLVASRDIDGNYTVTSIFMLTVVATAYILLMRYNFYRELTHG